MATVGVVFQDLSPEEAEFLAFVMATKNAEREAQGLPPFRDEEVMGEADLRESLAAWSGRWLRAAADMSGNKMTVTVTAENATPEQQRAADWILSVENRIREQQGLPPWDTLSDWLSDHILNVMLPQWFKKEAAEHLRILGFIEAYAKASDGERLKAKEALGL